MTSWKSNAYPTLIPSCNSPGRRFVFNTWSQFKTSVFYTDSIVLWRWVKRDKFIQEMLATNLKWSQIIGHLPADPTLDILEFCTAAENISVGVKPLEDEKVVYLYLIECGVELHSD